MNRQESAVKTTTEEILSGLLLFAVLIVIPVLVHALNEALWP